MNETIHSLAISRNHISNHTIDNVDNYVKEWWRVTHLTLHEEIYKTRIEYQKIKAERDTLIDDISWYKAKIDRLECENSRLTRLTRKLTTHRTMWCSLKDWRRDMLEIDKNDTQLIGLGLVMDELEHNWLYKEEK